MVYSIVVNYNNYDPVIAQLVERRTVVDIHVDILRSLVQIRLAGRHVF